MVLNILLVKKMNKVKLSVVLATHNEEANLARCLESVKSIADEIVIVDGESTDETVKIAQKYNARVIITKNRPIFHINKQKALELAQGEWVLLLDADEAVSPKLSMEISQVINLTPNQLNNRPIPQKLNRLYKRHINLLKARDGQVGTETGEVVAFFVPRSNLFLNKFLKKGGQYPDFTLRLVKNGKGKYLLQTVHDQMKIDGKVSLLENDLLHFATPTFERYLVRFDRYTSLAANDLAKEKIPINIFTAFQYLILKPVFTFFILYFRCLGIIDGFPGFVFALFSGLHHSIAYIKYWQRTKYPA